MDKALDTIVSLQGKLESTTLECDQLRRRCLEMERQQSATSPRKAVEPLAQTPLPATPKSAASVIDALRHQVWELQQELNSEKRHCAELCAKLDHSMAKVHNITKQEEAAQQHQKKLNMNLEQMVTELATATRDLQESRSDRHKLSEERAHYASRVAAEVAEVQELKDQHQEIVVELAD